MSRAVNVVTMRMGGNEGVAQLGDRDVAVPHRTDVTDTGGWEWREKRM